MATLTGAFATAQQVASGQPSELRFDTATVTSGTYTNECLGFSLAIPTGWEINTQGGGTDGTSRAPHLPGGGLGLLVLDRHTDPPHLDRIALLARDAGSTTIPAKDYVTMSVQGQIGDDRGNRELLRDAFMVQYGGKEFYRSDYKQNLHNGNAMYLGFVYTKFRNYFLGETLMTGSQTELNEAADSLSRISFREDQVNPKCIMGEAAGARSGIIGGVIGSVQRGSDGKPTRVRVSETVSRGLLINIAQPKYPQDAGRARIQGLVIVKVVVDTSGNVEDVTPVYGDPMLTPAAIAAVKNWKYKPYKLDGQPVKVETQATLDFQLPVVP
jgi:TonB family protein